MQEIVQSPEQSLAAYEAKTNELTRQATDICNLPVVKEGYALSGKPSATVFMNLQAMALSRVKNHYMNCDPKDPLCRRLIAAVKVIVAECIKRKYEMRKLRSKYDHIADINMRVRTFFAQNLRSMQEEAKQICAT